MKERDKQIIDLYINHPELSSQDIANKFGISTATISRIVRIHNIPRRHGNSGVKLSTQDEMDIINAYLNSTPKIALQKQYGISWDRLQTILKKNNVKQISTAKRLNPTLLENYFEHIDSKDKAYWLGWLISYCSITN